MEKARYWRRLDSGQVRCELCPHGCTLREGADGICRVRGVRDGELRALSYGAVASMAMDPIEKKPLYHYRPGSAILSVGGWGCNLRCTFCQNWTLSQQAARGSDRYAPQSIVDAAHKHASRGIAYTYNEPLVAFEFVEACAVSAREQGLFNVLVTNGFIEPGPAAELLPVIQALNIDLKSMDDAFYREYCGGSVAPVRRFAVQARDAGCHVEITSLLIPGLNDSRADIAALAEWVCENLGETTPLHLSAYRPQYKMDVPATPSSLLLEAFKICRDCLPYVYLGNVPTDEGRDTVCPACGAVLLSRSGYAAQVRGLEAGTCTSCGRPCPEILLVD